MLGRYKADPDGSQVAVLPPVKANDIHDALVFEPLINAQRYDKQGRAVGLPIQIEHCWPVQMVVVVVADPTASIWGRSANAMAGACRRFGPAQDTGLAR